jgi:hypothetical protein
MTLAGHNAYADAGHKKNINKIKQAARQWRTAGSAEMVGSIRYFPQSPFA